MAATEPTVKVDGAKPRQTTNPHWKRKVAQWSRWMHIYLSMVSFALLFFFSITGITLNHQDRFAGEPKSHRYQGVMNTEWLKPPNGRDIAKLEIVEYLRMTNGVKGALSDFRVENNQLQLSFKGPGYEADAFIDRETGKYEVNESRMGVIAIVNDLHKGRDTGSAWSKVIDISAVMICLVSASGLVLIFFLHKRRASGLMALAAGALLCLVVYWIWVP